MSTKGFRESHFWMVMIPEVAQVLCWLRTGCKGLTAGGFVLPPSINTPNKGFPGWSNVWLWGGWCWPVFWLSKRKGEGWKGAVGPSVTLRPYAELRKKCHSCRLHAHRICKPGFASSEFLLQAYVSLLHMWGKPLAWCARENIMTGCFKNAAIYFCETDWKKTSQSSRVNSESIRCLLNAPFLRTKCLQSGKKPQPTPLHFIFAPESFDFVST